MAYHGVIGVALVPDKSTATAYIDKDHTHKQGVTSRGLQRDYVYLGCPIAPSYMSPNAWVHGGSCGVSANEYSCTLESK